MAKLSTRAFCVLRFRELRTFFEDYYGDYWAEKIAKATGIRVEAVREVLTARYDGGGRPSHSAFIRLIHASRLEKLAHSLGWRSALNTRAVKSLKTIRDGDLLVDPWLGDTAMR